MPDGSAAGETAAAFETFRPRLMRVAYRMLGSVADAEDVVQDAFIRWASAAQGEVREPLAFLIRVVTRLCLDRLKAARRAREAYVGPWLPAPIVEAAKPEDGDDVSLILMMALERLSPLERAAFLLHDVFGLGFDEVAETLGRTAPACRQLAVRARRHLRDGRPRFSIAPDEGLRMADAFFEASRTDDPRALRRLLAADAVAYTDGGGVRVAAINPIIGRDRVAAMFHGLARKVGFARPPLVRRGWIDALPGFVTIERGEVLQTTALQVEDGLIRAVYIVRNPDKLRHLAKGGERGEGQ